MSTSALAGLTGMGSAKSDRIDVTDAAGVRIGWVDPRTGVRNLLVPERRVEFDQMIDYWMTAAGLTGVVARSPMTDTTDTTDTTASEVAEAAPVNPSEEPSSRPQRPGTWITSTSAMRVCEVRFPDAEVVRSLLIPLRSLR